MENRETALLSARELQARAGADTAIYVCVFGSCLTIVLVAAAGLLIRRDMIRRKHAEDALRTNEDRLERLVETIADGIFMLDATGQVVFANASAEALYGIPRGTLIQRTHDDATWK